MANSPLLAFTFLSEGLLSTLTQVNSAFFAVKISTPLQEVLVFYLQRNFWPGNLVLSSSPVLYPFPQIEFLSIE